jgi:hypothetical protein
LKEATEEDLTITLMEKKCTLYEMGYVCRPEDNAGILVLVNTRETPHEKGFSHAHLQDMSKRDIARFFITEETPQSKNDLRFIKGTFTGQIPTKYKNALVTWANAPILRYGILGWELLRYEWENLRPSGISPYP